MTTAAVCPAHLDIGGPIVHDGEKMKRYLVIFSSHATPPSDATVVDVVASSELEAIRDARTSTIISHPWKHVSAIPWPKGCPDINEAAARMSAR